MRLKEFAKREGLSVSHCRRLWREGKLNGKRVPSKSGRGSILVDEKNPWKEGKKWGFFVTDLKVIE